MAISINRAIGINSPTSPKSSQVISYTKSLSEKYDYFNNKTSVSGIPTTVKVSSAFIRQCSNDPEKAQKLEEHLNAIPKCVETAIKGCLGTITNLSYSIDSKGNMSVAISGSSDPDGKIARENAERKATRNIKRYDYSDYRRTPAGGKARSPSASGSPPTKGLSFQISCRLSLAAEFSLKIS